MSREITVLRVKLNGTPTNVIRESDFSQMQDELSRLLIYERAADIRITKLTAELDALGLREQALETLRASIKVALSVVDSSMEAGQ